MVTSLGQQRFDKSLTIVIIHNGLFMGLFLSNGFSFGKVFSFSCPLCDHSHCYYFIALTIDLVDIA